MSTVQQIILGTYPNDGTGDDLRTAFVKTQANINSLNDDKIESGVNLGTGIPILLGKNGTSLSFRSIKTANSNLSISFDSSTITLDVADSLKYLVEDLNPAIGGNLDLNNFDIVGNGNISIIGDIAADSFTGDVIGNLIGNVLGNVSGQVTDISNHSLSSLNDVSLTEPSAGQALVWNGVAWGPGTVTVVSGVNRIIAGSNITISPTNGVGDVTINATGGGSITELNTFDFGNFTNTFTNPLAYLLNQVGLDFGSFTTPSQFTVELGSF